MNAPVNYETGTQNPLRCRKAGGGVHCMCQPLRRDSA